MVDVVAWFKKQPTRIAGLDEAGRGPLAGPVVAAAVVLDPEYPLPGLNDSKKLSAPKREALYGSIMKTALAVGVASFSPQQIDTLNILRASLQAMAEAFEKAERAYGMPIVGALIDGNQRAPLPGRVEQHTIVDGDALWECIMAASIVAKVTRDRCMVEADALYPGYGFSEHKGYGTPEHLIALRKLGPCPIHRMSYAPVAQLELF